MRTELIAKLEYIKQCAEHAILQERRGMELIGNWYIEQQFSEIERSLEKSRAIFREGKQIPLFPKKI